MSKYLLQNRFAKFGLYGIDTILSFFLRPNKKELPIPNKLLLCNGAHLGDVILTTALLTPLKETYPDLKIGMLVGSWSKPVIENHPFIDFVHFVDHWKLNRSQLSLPQKINHYFKTKKKVLSEISHYDTAIDFNFHFPNAAHLLYQAKIPTRIGFDSAGFGAFLTHPHPWTFSNQSVVHSFATLLPHCAKAPLKPVLPSHNLSPYKDYLVIHMGSGSPLKQWPKNKWQKLCKKIDRHLIFTGKGQKEHEEILFVSQGLKKTTNLCDKLSFSEFVSVIAGSDLLISVDTSAGHIAAAVDTPSVLIYPSIHPPTLWAPFSKKATILTNMKGIQEIDDEEVYQAIQRKLRR